MAVYGKRRRLKTSVLLTGALIASLIAAGLLFSLSSLCRSPSPQAIVSQEAQQMLEGLDVLIISHYTEDMIRDGRVLLTDEYQAALNNLELLRQRLKRIRPYLDPQQAAVIQAALAELQAMVEGKRPPAEVQRQAERLMELLRPLTD